MEQKIPLDDIIYQANFTNEDGHEDNMIRARVKRNPKKTRANTRNDEQPQSQLLLDQTHVASELLKD